MYPNPAKFGTQTQIAYRLNGSGGKIEVFDGYSRLVYSEPLQNASGTIHLPELNQSEDRDMWSV